MKGKVSSKDLYFAYHPFQFFTIFSTDWTKDWPVAGVNGKFELEEYHEVPAEWPRPAQEINRIAILPAYRSSARSIALFCMLHALMAKCDSDGVMTGFCTTNLPNPGGLFLSLGMRKAEGKPLRNDRWEQEGDNTWLLYFTRESLPSTMKRVKRICDLAGKRGQF